MTCAFVHRHRVVPVLRSLALATAFVAATSIAYATDYDEASSGDLSNNATAPTNLGQLIPGTNRISGMTIPSGTFDPATHAYSTLDNDYVTFSVPTGYVLSEIMLAADSVIQPTDRLFLSIAQGSTAVVDPSFSSAAGLLGWTLVSPSMITANLLPDLGLASPANFPAIGGATGFTSPLASGQYTLWVLDGDAPVTYDFKLNVAAAVPEPANWALLLAGLAVIGAVRRRRAE